MKNHSIRIPGTCYWAQDTRNLEITFWPQSNKFHISVLSSLDKYLGGVVVDAQEIKEAFESLKMQEKESVYFTS